jgi:UDP-glucose 6-dehydrogenase
MWFGVDIDSAKVAAINQAIVPIYEEDCPTFSKEILSISKR